MSFQKNVKKYQKIVLGSIVAVMAVSLVIWGNPVSDAGDGGRTVAMYFDAIPVTERDWIETTAKARPFYRWKFLQEFFQSREPWALYQRHRLFEGILSNLSPREEDLKIAAQELIVLTFDARTKSLHVSDAEVTQEIQGLFQAARQTQRDPESQALFTRRHFGCDPATFKAMIHDALLIRKTLEADTAGANVRYADLYESLLQQSQSARVGVAAIDPERLSADPPPIGHEEVNARFERDREQYKVPERAQFEYLMVDLEECKKRAPEPAADEIKKYYEEHKREFPKTGAAPEGGTTEEFKTLDEARAEIVDKIKAQHAGKEAYDLFRKINSEDIATMLYEMREEERRKIGETLKDASAPEKEKAVNERMLQRSAEIFESIKKKYEAQNAPLAHNVTVSFDRSGTDTLEKEIGKAQVGSQWSPMDWAFQNPVGSLAERLWRTDKGYVLFRIARKVEGYLPDLTEPIREKILRELRVEKKRQWAERIAQEVIDRLQNGGDSALARILDDERLEVQRSVYFTEDAAGDLGLKPSALATHVKQIVFPPNLPAAKRHAATLLHGERVAADRNLWAYVVFLEDLVAAPPQSNPETFLHRRDEQEAQARAERMRARRDELLALADWRDVGETKGK
ncbi:MAG: hypothetical protein HY716_01095 [Planctomycetes bacterium]|nr:hypothetical protein [Planctomycetota bacterium]